MITVLGQKCSASSLAMLSTIKRAFDIYQVSVLTKRKLFRVCFVGRFFFGALFVVIAGTPQKGPGVFREGGTSVEWTFCD